MARENKAARKLDCHSYFGDRDCVQLTAHASSRPEILARNLKVSSSMRTAETHSNQHEINRHAGKQLTFPEAQNHQMQMTSTEGG